MRAVVSLIAAGALCLGMAGEAQSHTQWADGSPVPPWVRNSCCGPEDVHHLTPDMVHQVSGGYKVDGYPDVIPYDKPLPSQDGDYWIFYKHTVLSSGGDYYSPVYCFFVPMGA